MNAQELDTLARLRERVRDGAATSNDQEQRALPPVASATAIRDAEMALGVELPPLLRAAYEQLGNGGFGPGYGLLGVHGGHVDEHGRDLVGVHAAFRAPDDVGTDSWPHHFVPICTWGSAIFSCVDCRTAGSPIVTFDPGSERPGDPGAAFAQTHSSLSAWLADWCDGVEIWDLMFEDDPENSRAGINPFTKLPMVYRAQRLRRWS